MIFMYSDISYELNLLHGIGFTPRARVCQMDERGSLSHGSSASAASRSICLFEWKVTHSVCEGVGESYQVSSMSGVWRGREHACGVRARIITLDLAYI